jgi:hypothetical protein
VNDHTHVVLSNDPPTASFGMPRCRGCRWWEPGGRRENARLGCCVLTQTGAGSVENPRPDSKALAVIGGGNDHLWPYLRTSPDFGCVQFEPKGEGE